MIDIKQLMYFFGKNKVKNDADIESQIHKPVEFVQNFTSLLNIANECVVLLYFIIIKDNIVPSVISIFIPILTTYVGNHKNRMFNNFTDGDNASLLISMFVMYEILSSMIQNYFMWRQVRAIYMKSRQELEVAKIKCSVHVPGKRIAEYNEVREHLYKLREFAVVPGMIWTTSISFLITIFGIETTSDNLLTNPRFVILISSLCTLLMLIYINDNKLYEKKKYNSTIITELSNSEHVLIRKSYGAAIDYDHNFNRMNLQERQGNIQKIVVCVLNFVIIWISLSSGSKQHVLNFMSITWLISTLADNIKGCQYYSFVREYMNITDYLKRHSYKCSDVTCSQLQFDNVIFDNVTYGYMEDSLERDNYDVKVNKFSYTFNIGNIYYIEAPNGGGKSTLLRTFTHNLISGNIYFNNSVTHSKINRSNISWDQLHSSIFHLVQASEYCPKFRKEDIDARMHSDEYLKRELCVTNLFEKSSAEMSGGEKQRMNLYLALTSYAPIILLDEILSEISVIPSDEYPSGLRNKVISAIINWPNKKNKLIIIVGHGVFDNYVGKEVTKLNISVEHSETKLVSV